MNLFLLFACFLLGLIALGAACCLGILLVSILSKHPERVLGRWMGACGLLAFLALFAIVGGCTEYVFWGEEKDPRVAFQMVLAKQPTSTVRELHGVCRYSPYGCSVMVQFVTDEQSFRTLLPSYFGSGAESERPVENPPAWWILKPAIDLQRYSYHTDSQKRGPHGLSREQMWMNWNPQTGLVQLWGDWSD